jgi:dCMP deaminase
MNTNDEISWDQYFMSMAYLVSLKSKDKSTKVGCVIVGPDNEVVSTGYNSFPRLLNDNVAERSERPLKYMFIEHAERNAIANAARIGVSTKDCRIYMPWYPCVDCARIMIQSGIKELIIHTEHPGNQANAPHWIESMTIGREMLDECQVAVRWWSGKIIAPQVVFQGQLYNL